MRFDWGTSPETPSLKRLLAHAASRRVLPRQPGGPSYGKGLPHWANKQTSKHKPQPTSVCGNEAAERVSDVGTGELPALSCRHPYRHDPSDADPAEQVYLCAMAMPMG